MEIIRGTIPGPQKVLIYGPEGIGKSYFASRFPNPVFIDTEGSTRHMDVARTPKPSSWTMLLQQVAYFKANPNEFDTLVIDTADWAEQLCKAHICAKANKDGIEDFGYGKGYTYLAEEFGRLLNLLQELIDAGMHIVLVAHATMRKFEQPDEMGAYDRWELKLEKKVYPLTKEWADLILFANYKTYVVKTDEKTAKAQGGKRVMYTTHHPCWDAKNRCDLVDELPLDYDEIKHCILPRGNKKTNPAPINECSASSRPEKPADPGPAITDVEFWADITKEIRKDDTPQPRKNNSKPEQAKNPYSHLPTPLVDLMLENGVLETEITRAVASRGYYPENTPIINYDPGFVEGVLIGAWPQIFAVIEENRTIPY